MLLKFGLIVLTIMAVVFIVRLALRKALKIETSYKKIFSYNHINNLHAKIDWGIRTTFIVINITLVNLMIYRDLSFTLFVYAMTLYLVLDYVIRAFFEWKYTSNPKQSIITMVELVIIVMAVVCVIQLNILDVS